MAWIIDALVLVSCHVSDGICRLCVKSLQTSSRTKQTHPGVLQVKDALQTPPVSWWAAPGLWSPQTMTSDNCAWFLKADKSSFNEIFKSAHTLSHPEYEYDIIAVILTLGNLKGVELGRLDVIDQRGHFLCGKGFRSCCTLKKHKTTSLDGWTAFYEG